MTRRKHALQVTEVERAHIRRLYLSGATMPEVARFTKRSIAVVQRAVRGLRRHHRPWPPRSAALARRNAKIVARHKAGMTIAALARTWKLTPTRVCQIIGQATGRLPTRAEPEFPPVPAGLLVAARPKQLTKKQAKVRDRKIRRLYREGVTLSALARRFQISRQRVHQLVGRTSTKPRD